MYDLSSKTAMVTGAGRGIGKGTALRLAAEGADVIVVDLNEANARQTAAEVETLGRRSLAIASDLGDLESLSTIGKICRAESRVGDGHVQKPGHYPDT